MGSEELRIRVDNSYDRYRWTEEQKKVTNARHVK
jgi:hypothetical protein